MGLFGRRKGKQVRDPVCGMLLIEAEAIGPDVIAGETFYYCSSDCQQTHHDRKGVRAQERPARA